jgi:predicted RNA binding protein YcfA (HicA-like mRNA interferase family)
MKRRGIVKKLEAVGWVIVHGKKHDMAKHPDKPGIKIPIPRHKEIKETTAQGILEEAGLE